MPDRPRRGGRLKYHDDAASTSTERMQNKRAGQEAIRLENVAVLDFETDPFAERGEKVRERIEPFTACLYSDQFDPIVIWEDDLETFIDAVIAAIMSLPEAFTIYAHNGGKFDYMFLIHKLRGAIAFKGRGIMSAKLGPHELRDSAHILPMKLSDWKKDDFEYWKMKRENRHKYRDEIIKYMVSDCKNLFEIVKAFLNEFGFRISIGQAAMKELKKTYKVGKIGGQTDLMLRRHFYGGRVECLGGRGHFDDEGKPGRKWKLFDVNSMYPDAMANHAHPISSNYTKRRNGGITRKTCFLELSCSNSGALVRRGDNNETSANFSDGRFQTTIWEFRAAVELGLISDIKIHAYIDNEEFSDFSGFILPMYERRQVTKQLMSDMKKAGVSEEAQEFLDVKREDIFIKFVLNNSFGKFAQNPRKYKEYRLTDHGDKAPAGFEDALLPSFQSPAYDIWQRPAPFNTFNNVGTAASITGAARAKLMRAIHNAIDPIYCDTDSLICRELYNVEIDKTKLGAWDLEAEFDEVVIAGKKMYACKTYSKDYGQADKIKIRSKGVYEGALAWSDMLQMLDNELINERRDAGDPISIPVRSKAPTMTRKGEQFYITRNIRATAPILARRTTNPERLIA